MRVTFKGANGKYIAAELGGGIDSRYGAAVALRADRPEAGAWETYRIVVIDATTSKVAVQTDSGCYWTAEGGGGGVIRTNAREINAWEIFTYVSLGDYRYALLAADGIHFVCVEVGSVDPIVNCTRTTIGPWETLGVTWLDKPTRPTADQLIDIRGNMISMRDAWNRVMLAWFWPKLAGADERHDWMSRWRRANLSHVMMCPVMQYRDYEVPADDWRGQPYRFADAVGLALDNGFIPIVQMTSGDGGTGQDIETYWPGLLAALRPHLPYCVGSCGFEVVGPNAGWTSAQLSRGLLTLQAAGFGATMVHLQPERATGSSYKGEGLEADTPAGCVWHDYYDLSRPGLGAYLEEDDPWEGNESEFWSKPGLGGDKADILYYQTPHGAKLLDRSLTGASSWKDRWKEIVERSGIGAKGWRKIHLCMGEKTGFDYYHNACTDDDVIYTSNGAKEICAAAGITCSFGDGLP